MGKEHLMLRKLPGTYGRDTTKIGIGGEDLWLNYTTRHAYIEARW